MRSRLYEDAGSLLHQTIGTSNKTRALSTFTCVASHDDAAGEGHKRKALFAYEHQQIRAGVPGQTAPLKVFYRLLYMTSMTWPHFAPRRLPLVLLPLTIAKHSISPYCSGS